MVASNRIEFAPATVKFKPLYERTEYNHIVYESGRGCAKSWGISEAIVTNMLTYKMRVFCARSIQKSLSTSSWQTIKETASRLGVADKFEWVESKSLIRCPSTGSDCYFGGIENDPEKFKSTEGIDFFWFEEAQTATQEVIDVIRPTVRKDGSICVWSANLKYENDAFSRNFIGTDDDKILVIHLTQDDNPFFPQKLRDEMEYMKRMDYEKYRHIWLGEFASASSEALIAMSAVTNCIGLDVGSTSTSIVIAGLDVGATGDATAGICRQGRRWLAMDEWHEADHIKLADLVTAWANDNSVDILCIDGTGFGYTFAQLVRQRLGDGRVMSVNFGSAALMPGYANRRAEMAAGLRDAIGSGVCISNHSDLIEELGTVRAFKTKSNRWQLEDKTEIRKRLGRSCNWFDAAILLYATPDRLKSTGRYDNKSQMANKILQAAAWGAR